MDGLLIPREARLDVLTPAFQGVERIAAALVAEVVGRAREGVDPGQVPAQLAGQDHRGDREVLVVPVGQIAAVAIGRFQHGGVAHVPMTWTVTVRGRAESSSIKKTRCQGPSWR